ncbi:YbgS-like family protein [Trabulsiella odontotermitis]|uniref:Homeobox protein YbgS n=1 Tax=Trabulsiella odontotermitis TaxID=379893 RepID=A0A0L0GYF6_9ENTR|nr:YbgS-like family protein [Trabulsiella odontotermitis]KNC93789.1 hypothetical protein GM31_18140 [Trabulsiella odontotermitis]
MKMNKLASLFLTATLSLTSGAVLAATTGSDSNGDANAAAEAGQVAPDARQNTAPNNVDNSQINTGGTMLHPNDSTSGSANQEGMTKDEVHKNSMCKDGKCPDINKKVQTGDGINNDADTKTDGTTQ